VRNLVIKQGYTTNRRREGGISSEENSKNSENKDVFHKIINFLCHSSFKREE
jgi:hypothetical protein